MSLITHPAPSDVTSRAATGSALPPVPMATPLTRPFWDGCDRQRLMLQRCAACERLRFYPSESCPHCGTVGGDWVEISGRGTLYSWIVVHKSADAYWRKRVPYVSAIVELAEQPRLFMPGLLGVAGSDALRADLPLQVTFTESAPGRWLPLWRPVAAT